MTKREEFQVESIEEAARGNWWQRELPQAVGFEWRKCGEACFRGEKREFVSFIRLPYTPE